MVGGRRENGQRNLKNDLKQFLPEQYRNFYKQAFWLGVYPEIDFSKIKYLISIIKNFFNK